MWYFMAVLDRLPAIGKEKGAKARASIRRMKGHQRKKVEAALRKMGVDDEAKKNTCFPP